MKRLSILLLSLCLLCENNTSANQDFTSYHHVNNVMFISASWAYPSATAGTGSQFILAYKIQELLDELEEHVTVCLIGNAYMFKKTKHNGYVPFKWAMGYVNGRSAYWDVSKENENIKKPCLQIYYNDSSARLSDLLLLVYTGLKNRKEIERDQTSFEASAFARNYTYTNGYAKEVFSIDENTIKDRMRLYSEETGSLSYEKVYAIGEFNDCNPLNYYYQYDTFHFYKFKKGPENLRVEDYSYFLKHLVTSLRKYAKTQESSKRKDLLKLDGFRNILSFKSEFLVFNTDSTFYNISFTQDTALGPFTIHGLNRFDRQTLSHSDRLLEDSFINLNYRGYLIEGYDAKLFVSYNLHSGKVVSYISEVDTFRWKNEQQELEYKIKCKADSLLAVKEKKHLQKQAKGIASIMIVAMLVNALLIVRAARKTS